MKKNFLFIVLVVTLFAACTKQKDAYQVRQTFEGYKTAVKNHAGADSILLYLDRESHDALRKFEEVAKRNDWQEINDFCNRSKAPNTWRYLIEMLRPLSKSVYNPDSINEERTFLLFSLAGFPIVKAEQMDNFLFKEIVKQTENTCTVKITIAEHFFNEKTRGKVNVNKEFVFRKEKDGWKFNFLPYFEIFDKIISQEASSKNMSPEQYIRKMVTPK